MSLLAVLPVVYGIKALATGAEPVGVAIPAVVVGVAVGALFVHRQLRMERPLLDLSLFRLSRVSIILGALIGAGIVMSGVGMLITQYLQTVLGYSPVAAAVGSPRRRRGRDDAHPDPDPLRLAEDGSLKRAGACRVRVRDPRARPERGRHRYHRRCYYGPRDRHWPAVRPGHRVRRELGAA